MIFRFANFELDTERVELRRPNGTSVALERQVYQLLLMLVSNGDRLTTRDEIVDNIWDGRAISEAAIDSRISAVRAAIGDDGRQQRLVRTVHGQGFRFRGEVAVAPDALSDTGSGPPSIGILPLQIYEEDPQLLLLADALPHELILQLSRLHWLTVIARGTSFRFRDQPDTMAPTISTALNARYLLFGQLERDGTHYAATVQLLDTARHAVVWAERYHLAKDDLLGARAVIASAITAELDLRIPVLEAAQARTLDTEKLDAWSCYHLGLQQMYRFNARANAAAASHFRRAIARDPAFARAHAGLSFTRFQDAFAYYDGDRKAALSEAKAHAADAMDADPFDPFSNYVWGRTFWLDGDLDGGMAHIERAVSLNPNYAQGHYTLGFLKGLSGCADEAIARGRLSYRLSPLDPLAYGTFGTQAMGLLHQNKLADAAEMAERSALTPGAHYLVSMIVVAFATLADQPGRAGRWANDVRSRRSDATRQMFLKAFPFRDPHWRARIDAALATHGF
ncbi:transcriptional regulator [Martelella alba]|uniref:Transcriptional regulator n=1 Tax=Martelella alba TaxID=2590451 RepID=A0A506TWT5_9HYPH|nr:winged helix-turn-helix domain-containing protein [Martelella alba]TPW26502.1 transcriptional regulator [Martelella alba]